MPDFIFDRLKIPPSAALLGWRLLDLNVEEKWIRVGFDGKPEFRNPAGNIQGGILAAMLDDTMGPIVVAATDAKLLPATVDLCVGFIRPVKPGPISVLGRITNMGKQLAFLEGSLFDAAERLCARATASALLMTVAPE